MTDDASFQEVAKRLIQRDQIIKALDEYHAALDRRESGTTAANAFIDKVQKITNKPWRGL